MTIISSSQQVNRPAETRLLICESKTCNPRIFEFTAVCERFAQFGDNRGYLVEMRKELVYTVHVVINPWDHYDARIGWCKSWRCSECGNVRKF